MNIFNNNYLFFVNEVWGEKQNKTKKKSSKIKLTAKRFVVLMGWQLVHQRISIFKIGYKRKKFILFVEVFNRLKSMYLGT